MKITNTDLGRHLYTFGGVIYLRKNDLPIAKIRFEDEQLARRVALEIRKLFGEDLDYLYGAKWLVGLSQIGQGKRDRYILGDALGALEKKDINIGEDGIPIITKAELLQCVKEIIQEYSMKLWDD
jgi:hypothetical protein